MTDRPYLFHELTNAICSTCLRKVEAMVIEQDSRIYLDKRCPEHGHERVLIATDAEYWRLMRRTVKPGQVPKRFNTKVEYSCPMDCGLCPGHEQHSCLTVVEITDRCNLECPVCYAGSAPDPALKHRSLEQVIAMLDAVVANEGEPDIVQISGGEPTLHPDFFTILDEARARPIKHLMVNTNGVRLASDRAFAEKLATYMPGFELYLQFDSLNAAPIKELRGADLRESRMKAIDTVNELGISTTLVVTVQKGLNDHELGELIDYAIKQPAVRGVTFQPTSMAGRVDEKFDPAVDRLTLTEVRTKLLEQSSLFTKEDVVPVPCHPDCIAMGYALKLPPEVAKLLGSKQESASFKGRIAASLGMLKRNNPASEAGVKLEDGRVVVPLTRYIEPGSLLEHGGSTIVYEQVPELRQQVVDLFSTAHSPESSANCIGNLLCCLPGIEMPQGIGYDNLFRVIIMQFMDPWNLDVRSVKKSCVHIAHPDGRIIPFDTYNIFYRPGLEENWKRAAKASNPLMSEEQLERGPIPLRGEKVQA